MNGQRRHANDFTDSLNSFRQVSEEQDEDVFEVCLQDSLVTDSIKNGQYEDNYNVTKNDTGSIILAGNFARQQSDSFETIQGNCINTYKAGQPVKDILIVSDETYLPLKPDLNKCINLFHNEYLKECDDTKKYLNISSSLSELRIDDDIELNKNKSSIVQLIRDCRRSLSSDSFKSTTTPPNVETRKCKSCTMLNSNLKRDTNYNIKSDKLFSTEAVIKSNQDRVELKFVSLYDQFSLPQTPVLQKESEECQEPDSSSQRSLKEELDPSELRAFLQSLDDKKPTEEPEQERLLRRLSITYYDSPKHFTERLLTIIEESTESQANVSLCRLLEEFQKCNYIEDETAPEWLHSSPGMSTSIRMRKRSQEFKRDLLRKSLGAATPNKDTYPATPMSPRLNINSSYKIYRHPKSILYNVGSPLLDNTSTFESLEAYCEKLYPNEYKTLTTAEKNANQWQSPLRNKNRILRACENQIASLENSPNIRDQLKARRSSLDSVSQRNTVPEALCRLLSYEHKTDLKSVPDIFKQRTEHNKHYERIKQDNLRHSLIHEIAKKRQKCIDTVKMMETDVDSERAQEICQITTNSKCNSSTGNNDTKFMKTLECVKKYQDYLEQSKPFLNLLQQSESYSSHIHDKKDTPTKKISNKNINTDITVVSPSKITLKVPKSSPRTRKKSTSPLSLKPSSANKIIFSKPKLFYTPGKTTPQAVVKNGKPKRTYFPNLLNSTNKQKENVSPHEKNYYRQCGTYDYVKSPVGSYIRGTDPYLVKNLRPKTDENLLTPRKKKTNRSPSPKPKMKIRLSPKKSSIRTPVRDEDAADNFLYPKVNYKLPLHVRTIKENSKAGNRVNQLLRSTQDKVVIRHEGRTKSVQTDCSEQPEIHYDSAEESVHIEQTARKTYCCRMQKK